MIPSPRQMQMLHRLVVRIPCDEASITMVGVRDVLLLLLLLF